MNLILIIKIFDHFILIIDGMFKVIKTNLTLKNLLILFMVFGFIKSLKWLTIVTNRKSKLYQEPLKHLFAFFHDQRSNSGLNSVVYMMTDWCLNKSIKLSKKKKSVEKSFKLKS